MGWDESDMRSEMEMSGGREGGRELSAFSITEVTSHESPSESITPANGVKALFACMPFLIGGLGEYLLRGVGRCWQRMGRV